MDTPQNHMLLRIYYFLTSSLLFADLQEQFQTLRTAYFDPYVLEPLNGLPVSPIFIIFFLVIVLFILYFSFSFLRYVYRMVMLAVQLVFLAAVLCFAWYIYTVGLERAGRNLGWLFGVLMGFAEDFQAGSAGNAGKGDGTGWYPGMGDGGRTGTYGSDAWGGGREL